MRPSIASLTASSKSQSSKIISGSFPPSSSDTCFSDGAHIFDNSTPTSVLPVKLTALIRGSAVSHVPILLPLPVRHWIAFAGTPASTRSSHKIRAPIGVSDEGLRITLFPVTSIGAVLCAASSTG